MITETPTVAEVTAALDAIIKARIRLDLMGLGLVESDSELRIALHSRYQDLLKELAKALIGGGK